jgi:hypothetical protein
MPVYLRKAYPVGAEGQALGRGLVPRFSIGTLQLSIRCSSIHLRPSLSLPVSTRGESSDVAAFGAAMGGTFCEDAGTVKHAPSRNTSKKHEVLFGGIIGGALNP